MTGKADFDSKADAIYSHLDINTLVRSNSGPDLILWTFHVVNRRLHMGKTY